MRKNALSEIMSYLNKRADDDNWDGHYRFSKVEFDAHFRVPFFSANTFLHFSHSNFFFFFQPLFSWVLCYLLSGAYNTVTVSAQMVAGISYWVGCVLGITFGRLSFHI
jgi:hypothetical protein